MIERAETTRKLPMVRALVHTMPGLVLMVLLMTALAGIGAAKAADARSVETKIEAFLREAYTKNWFHEPDNVRRVYSDPVEYWFGRTGMQLAKVVNAKQGYQRQWPLIENAVVDGTMLVVPVKERTDTYLVRFQQRHLRGRRAGAINASIFETELLIRMQGERIVVQGEDGRFLGRSVRR